MKELILESDDYPSTIMDYIDRQVQNQVDRQVMYMVLFRVEYSIEHYQCYLVENQVRAQVEED